jgi:membrane dipeptidase
VEWRQRVRDNDDRLILALAAADFERAKASGRTAVLMNFQDTTMLEGEVANVDALHALGMRCAQLTYNFRNLVGDGCLERTNAGLSDFGVEVVARMNDIGVLIDLSHCGRQTTLDGIEFSNKPVAMTHTMCEAIRPGSHPRAKTDAQIRACAEKGGVTGIVALGYFVGPDPGGHSTVETYADHVEHAVKVAGIDHVALSTDFPPQGIEPWATYDDWYVPRTKVFKPSYELRWPPWIPELDSTDRFRNLLAVLDRRGWSTGDMEKLLGLNWLRLFRETIG